MRLYVIIDEYDHSLNKALSNKELVNKMTSANDKEINRIESVFQTFFTKLKYSCDEY